STDSELPARGVNASEEFKMNLAGKVALVTGAGRGIGRGCALEIARAGADVVVNDLREDEGSAGVVAEIRALGRRSELVAGDVFERTSCEDVVRRAVGAFGRIDAFVSNPAYSKRGDFLEYDPETFERVVSGTLTGGFHMSQLVARHMVERGGGGKIVFIVSIHARVAYARSVAYNAAKAGLKHMAKTIAAELLPHHINVNSIEPGWIDTPGEHAVFGTEAMAAAGPKLPWGRLGRPDDIGKAAAFLVSDDADYITGTSLLVDGGLNLEDARRGG
ncbi:MAG: SDR family oxidoreductase, partial [Isosphaeraceae bacterium]